jgi:Holliday junction resolvase RusA-like endonuclease
MKSLTFTVIGTPAPGGSKKGFYNKALGRVMIVEAGKNTKTWRQAVVESARAAIQKFVLETCRPFDKFEGPLRVTCSFLMPRTQAHYGKKKGVKYLKDTAPHWHITKPDATKLFRSTEDAISDAGVWYYDSQVAVQDIKKIYSDDFTGATITIEELER